MFMSETIALRTLCQYMNGDMDDREHLLHKFELAREELNGARYYTQDDHERRQLLTRWWGMWNIGAQIEADDLEWLAAALRELGVC